MKNECYITDEKLHDLASKIIFRAVDDYRRAVKKGDRRVFGECRAFFKSDWCNQLIDVSPIYVSNGKELLAQLNYQIHFDKEKFEKQCEIFYNKQECKRLRKQLLAKSKK